MAAENQMINDQLLETSIQRDELKAKVKEKNKWLLWLLIGFIISTGLHFVKLKIPFLK